MSQVPVKWVYEGDIIDDKKTLRDYEGAGEPVPSSRCDDAVKLLQRQRAAMVRKVKKLPRIDRMGKVNGNMVEFMAAKGKYVRIDDILAVLAGKR